MKTFTLDSVFRLILFCFVLVFGTWSMFRRHFAKSLLLPQSCLHRALHCTVHTNTKTYTYKWMIWFEQVDEMHFRLIPKHQEDRENNLNTYFDLIQLVSCCSFQFLLLSLSMLLLLLLLLLVLLQQWKNEKWWHSFLLPLTLFFRYSI